MRPILDQQREEASAVETLIQRSGCSAEFYALETCLGEHDRNWSACQEHVRAWKQCSQQPKPQGAAGETKK